MLYAAYEAQRVALDGARAASRAALETLDLLPPPLGRPRPRPPRCARRIRSSSTAPITHERLPFGIDKVTVVENRCGGACTRRSSRARRSARCCGSPRTCPTAAPPQPARAARRARCPGTSRPCSPTPCARMLPDHDVHITDWHNARDVGARARPVRARRARRPRRRVPAGPRPALARPGRLPAVRAGAGRGRGAGRRRNIAQPASMTLVAGPGRRRRQPDAR